MCLITSLKRILKKLSELVDKLMLSKIRTDRRELSEAKSKTRDPQSAIQNPQSEINNSYLCAPVLTAMEKFD